MLDYRLKTFLHLCENLNYTKTAEQLHMSQPAVSQHIRFLENTYEVKLFELHNRKLNLTNDGMKFYKQVISLDLQSRALAENMKNINDSKQSLKFDCTFTIGEYIIPKLLIKWLKESPKTELVMRIQKTSLCLESLNNGEIDFAIVEGFFDKAIYESMLIKQTKMGLVVSRNHPLTKKEKVYLKDLLEYKLIIRKKESRLTGILPIGLAEHNCSYASFDSLIQCGSINVMKELIKEECGIGFIHEDTYRQELKNNELVEISIDDFELKREINIVYFKNSIDQTILNKLYQDIIALIESNN